MKIAYRIVTPLLAASAVVLSFFLKMFSFSFSALNQSNLDGILNNFMADLGNYSFYDIGKKLAAMTPKEDSGTSLLEIVKPVLAPSIAFFVFLIITVCIFFALIFVSSYTDNRKPIFILSAVGLVCMLVCIITSNSVFDVIIAGEKISLSDIVTAVSSSTWLKAGASLASISSATLSAGFYAMFGMFILIILWTVLAGFIAKTPIQRPKREYKRRKPMRRLIKKA